MSWFDDTDPIERAINVHGKSKYLFKCMSCKGQYYYYGTWPDNCFNCGSNTFYIEEVSE